MKSLSRTELKWIADALMQYAGDLRAMEAQNRTLAALCNFRADQITRLSHRLREVAESDDRRIKVE